MQQVRVGTLSCRRAGCARGACFSGGVAATLFARAFQPAGCAHARRVLPPARAAVACCRRVLPPSLQPAGRPLALSYAARALSATCVACARAAEASARGDGGPAALVHQPGEKPGRCADGRCGRAERARCFRQLLRNNAINLGAVDKRVESVHNAVDRRLQLVRVNWRRAALLAGAREPLACYATRGLGAPASHDCFPRARASFHKPPAVDEFEDEDDMAASCLISLIQAAKEQQHMQAVGACAGSDPSTQRAVASVSAPAGPCFPHAPSLTAPATRLACYPRLLPRPRVGSTPGEQAGPAWARGLDAPKA